MVSTFHKDHLEKPTAISAPLDSVFLMAKPTIQLPAKWNRGRPTRCAKKRAKWGDQKEVTKKRQQGKGDKEEFESVRFQSQKPARRWRSVSLAKRVSGSLQWQFDHWQFDSWRITQHLILTKFLIIQVLYHPSPSSSKSLIIQIPHWPNHVSSLPTNLGFSFPVLSPSWKVFSLTISTLYDLSIFLPVPLISWVVFH